jgi:hypothetical protein
VSYESNPRRRRRRRYHRRNPALIGGGYRRNPQFFGISVEESLGTFAGAIGTAYTDSAIVGPLAGGLLNVFGNLKPAASAVISTVGFHWAMQRFLRRWARMTAGGANLYGALGVANTVAPGLIPITVGVPKQLAGFRPLAAFQPPAAPAPTAAAMGTAGPAASLGTGAGGTVSQTGGRRIQAPNGM